MKINFTKKEYRFLIDILYIADWVLNAHKVEDDPRTRVYRILEQKIFSYAKEMGFENLIEHVTDFKEYFPSIEYEETSPALKFIEEFEIDTFWDELVDRLTERDLIRQVGGIENLSNLSFENRIEKALLLEEKYAAEFGANGLDNLEIT